MSVCQVKNELYHTNHIVIKMLAPYVGILDKLWAAFNKRTIP